MARNVVREKSYAFALATIGLARSLRERREFDLARQVLRSGTSIGANVEEAQAGLTRRDFIAKMSIARKEAYETHYWLRLLRDSQANKDTVITTMLCHCDELIRLLTAIVKSSQSERSGSQPRH